MRAACAFVAERSGLVHIDDDRLRSLAQSLALSPALPLAQSPAGVSIDDERLPVELAVTYGAVNFGSGWHPYLDKEPAKSGSVTIVTRLRRRFEADGPFTAADLEGLTPHDCARVFGQPMRPPVDELMALFARSLNDLGAFLVSHFDGSFAALVNGAGGSAARLVELLCEMPMYRDVAGYDGRAVPFLKRAQLTASDIGGFDDLDNLTVFADNLVPHVLRVEGVLRLDAGLAAAIDAGELLESGGQAEVELRAAAVVAGERMARAAAESDGPLTPFTPRQIDSLLWRRGQEHRFKAVPRPRVRTWFY